MCWPVSDGPGALQREVEQLRALLVSAHLENGELRSTNGELRATLEKAQQEHEAVVIRLTAELLTLKRQLFGPKAERIRNADAQQSFLDILVELGRLQKGDVAAQDRAEATLGELREESEAPASSQPTTERLPEKKKRKAKPHGRQKLEESNLPVVELVLEPIERKLPGGEELVRVGEEVSSHLDYRPSSIVRVEVTRPKYMRPEHVGTSAASAKTPPTVSADLVEETPSPASAPAPGGDIAPLVKVLIAEPPELPIPKGIAGPALLALVLVMKYEDHLPLFRQARIFLRQGVRLSRSTLCGLVQGCYELLRVLVEAMWVDAKANSPLLLTDACGVLIRAPERCRRGAFQVFIAPDRHVLFAYLKENNGKAVADLLVGFVGKLISDASSVYHETYRREPGVIEVDCWSHARRAFFKALASARELALTGIGFIGQLYDAHDAAVDPVTKLLDADKRKALAQPVLADFLAWIRQHRPRLVPHSPIEVAMGYIERQWVGLTRFLDDGTLRLDNNPSELALRHQKVGQKNWIFCATDGGAEWNAVVVSLLASCRMHGIEPLAYLRDLLILLPSWPKSRVLELAPASWRETLEKPETQEKLKGLQLIRYDLDHARSSSTADAP
jgi:transposase